MIVYSGKTAAKTAAIAMAAILGIGVITPAGAQSAADEDTTQQLLACDKISDMTEKLACFDSVVRGLKDGPAAPQAESPAATVAESVTPAPAEPGRSTATPAAAPVASSAAAAGAVAAPAAVSATSAATPVSAPTGNVAPKPAAAAGSSQSEVAPADMPPDPIDEFGRDSMQNTSEKVEKPKEAQPAKLSLTMHATVVHSWINNDGRFSVELDNGQIWRETEISQTRFQGDNDMIFGAPRSSSGRLPKAGNTVEISEGRMSGYRMKIEGIRQAAWVRRTK